MGPPLPSNSAARTEVTGAAAGSIANIPGAEATDDAGSARVRYQSPPEGGPNTRDEEIARLQMESSDANRKSMLKREPREPSRRGSGMEEEVWDHQNLSSVSNQRLQ